LNLSPTFAIALRFFLESKRSMLLSATGVIFGVGFFICGQAQTQGFQDYFIETILGTKGAVIVSDRFQRSFSKILQDKSGGMLAVSNPQSRKYYPGISDAYRVMQALMAYPNVVACAPVVEDNVTVRYSFRREVADLQGIDLAYHLQTTVLADQMISGDIETFRDNPDGLIMGSLLADRMEVKAGQNVFVNGPGGESRRFKLTGIFESGVSVIDEKRIYTHRRAAQSVLHTPFETSFIVVKLKDPNRAPQDCDAFEELLYHRSRSWQEREKGNMQIFHALRISAGLGISCIILLAGFGIFNVLTMSVLEKTKEIAILRSMGYTRNDISAIFLWQGFFVAALGIGVGWIFGALMTYGVSTIPIKIRGILKADHFIVAWSIGHYVWAAILASLSVFIAAFIPARRAAHVDPVNILRGSSQ
jgi:lipoprotein-releasing system permease protein